MAHDTVPAVGLGTARLSGERCEALVRAAVAEAGVRHVDTAAVYCNERAVGSALAGAGVPRGDLFVTSKLWNTDHHPEDVRPALERSLRDLRLGYLDLYLVHWPCAWAKGTVGAPPRAGFDIRDTWRALEACVDAGLVRAIGVSNFDRRTLQHLLDGAPRIRPAVNQLELHVFLQQKGLVKWLHEQGVQPVAWSPLAKLDRRLLEEPTLRRVAEKHGVSPVRVALRWNVQRGVAVIPRSGSLPHVAENLQAAHAPTLDADDVAAIDAIDEGRRCFPDAVGAFPDTASTAATLLGKALRLVARVAWTAVLPNRFDPRDWLETYPPVPAA